MEKNIEKAYKLMLSSQDGEINVNKEISEDLAHKILVLLVPSNSIKLVTASDTGETITVGECSPKAFMVEKRPATDMEKIACLAYYLARYRNMSEFKTEDLTDLNREAQQISLSNPSAAARNAVQFGYLTLAGGGRKQITTTGEGVVEALPDREKVKKVLNSCSRPRRKAKKGKNQSTE